MALIVDDDAGARGFTADALRLFGCEPLEASSGEQALNVLSRVAVDFVVLDVLMPKMSGWHTLDELRQQHPHLPVLMVSGYVGDDGLQIRDTSVTSFLEKPYSLEALYESVDRLLDRGSG